MAIAKLMRNRQGGPADMKVYKRILLIDNEPDFVESLRMTLAAKAHQVVTAKNRTEAEQMVGNEHFDALVLGTLVPRGDAFAFHQWLKRNPRTQDLPLLVIDARPERRLLEGWRRDEGMQLESDDYVAKPVEPAMLVPRIERLFEEATERIKVLVVDDHTVVREGIRAVLTLQRDIDVVGEAVDGRDGVEKTRQLMPDVVLMDIVMPVLSGLEATKQISKERPQSKVLILTQYDDKENQLTTREAGAWGFIPKRAASAQLLDGIRSVFRGKPFHVAAAAA
jgi:DNA-binding NarL/FixJ family response regulator